MAAGLRFTIYRDLHGEWRWRLHDTDNRRILADSGEADKNKENCRGRPR